MATFKGRNSQLEKYTLTVKDAYFAIPSFEREKPTPRVALYLSGEAVKPDGQRIDWTENWMTNGLPSDDGIALGTPGERSDFVVFVRPDGTQNPDGDFGDKSDVVKFFASAEAAGVPVEEKVVDPARSAGWVGMTLEIERKVTRTYQHKTEKNPDGTPRMVDVELPLVISYGGFNEGLAAAAGSTTSAPAAASTNGAAGGGTGPLTDQEIAAYAASAADQVSFLEAVVNASQQRGNPIAFGDPRLREVWTATQAMKQDA